MMDTGSATSWTASTSSGSHEEHRDRVPVDHGYLLGERGYTGKVPSQLHPELAQVPFVIVRPDEAAAGTVSSHFASTHDVGPRCCRWSASTGPRWMKGSDLSVTLDGDQPAQKGDFHYGGMYNRFYIRTDDWLLIGDNRGEERSLYDLRQDPHEFFNVRDRQPEGHEELYDRSSKRPAARCPTTTSSARWPPRRPPPRPPPRASMRSTRSRENDGTEDGGDDDAALPLPPRPAPPAPAGRRRAPSGKRQRSRPR